jgi:hypothetical protein
MNKCDVHFLCLVMMIDDLSICIQMKGGEWIKMLPGRKGGCFPTISLYHKGELRANNGD